MRGQWLPTVFFVDCEEVRPLAAWAGLGLPEDLRSILGLDGLDTTVISAQKFKHGGLLITGSKSRLAF